MPFTFSHPAVVLPVNYVHKWWISLTGLVIGSVAPDFEYFIRMRDRSHYSHTWFGVLWLDLPISIVLAFLFHDIVRNPFITNTPIGLYRRLSRYQDFNWNQHFKKKWLVISASMIIGIISHLLWDKVTHRTVHYINKLPVFSGLDNSITYDNNNYFLIWDISSLIGLLCVAYAFWQLPVVKDVKRNKVHTGYWFAVVSIAAIIFFIRLKLGWYLSLYDDVVSAITAILIGFVCASLLFRPHNTF